MWIIQVIALSGLCVAVMSQSLAHPDGSSNAFRHVQDNGNFDFGYDIVRGDGSKNSRQERGDASGNRAGAYSLLDADGRQRVVEYTAGKDGFNAIVRTNEPGTENQSPADVKFYASPVYARFRRSVAYPLNLHILN